MKIYDLLGNSRSLGDLGMQFEKSPDYSPHSLSDVNFYVVHQNEGHRLIINDNAGRPGCLLFVPENLVTGFSLYKITPDFDLFPAHDRDQPVFGVLRDSIGLLLHLRPGLHIFEGLVGRDKEIPSGHYYFIISVFAVNPYTPDIRHIKR